MVRLVRSVHAQVEVVGLRRCQLHADLYQGQVRDFLKGIAVGYRLGILNVLRARSTFGQIVQS